MLEFEVSGQCLKRTDRNIIASHAKNYPTIRFTFLDDWINGVKTAVFSNSTGLYHVVVKSDGSCIVPAEVLDERNFKLFLYNTYNGQRITTNRIIILVEYNGYDEGLTPEDPTPTVYEQILEMFNGLPSDVNMYGIYVGNTQPTNGVKYWLDTSSDVVYSITNNLINAINDNSAKKIAEGSPYIANISADAGYMLSEVIVTMGGKDVTSSVYSNGAIKITEVSGDIVITVTTIEKAVVTYSVTNSLKNVTSDNTSSNVEENASYIAYLTPDEGYTLEGASVKVTMGGVDVTETVVEYGINENTEVVEEININIPIVTGDIVITVSSVKAPTVNPYLDDEANVYKKEFNKDELDALTNEKIYLVVYTTFEYTKTIRITGMYNSDWGTVGILNATSSPNGDIVTAFYDHVTSDGYFIYEIDVQALKTKVQSLVDDGTYDTSKGTPTIKIVTTQSQATSSKVIYNYVD